MTSLSAKRISVDGLLIAVSLILSYLESIVFFDALLPIPGIKLGLANICVMLAFFKTGPVDAAFISLLRVAVSALLFGTPVSFMFSLFGAVLSYLFLVFAKYVLRESVSFIGISIACAALHNIGQVAAASLLFGEATVFSYLAILLPVSLLTGGVTGIIAAAVSGRREIK